MMGAGISVPPGFVVLTDAFERFLDATDLRVEAKSQLTKINVKQMSTIKEASEKIQFVIKRATMPEDIAKDVLRNFKSLKTNYVAVRSSATAEDSAKTAWAGQLDTFLNTTEKTLFDNVQNCWASLFTPRAIFYRFEHNLEKSQISVAVVVQKMVASEVAGVAFSVHLVTQNKDQMIIEAGWSLGEAVVSGSITQDSYVVDKKDWNIVDINVAEQEKMLVRASKGDNN